MLEAAPQDLDVLFRHCPGIISPKSVAFHAKQLIGKSPRPAAVGGTP
jgi:hypothetical protein